MRAVAVCRKIILATLSRLYMIENHHMKNLIQNANLKRRLKRMGLTVEITHNHIRIRNALGVFEKLPTTH